MLQTDLNRNEKLPCHNSVICYVIYYDVIS